MISLLPRFDHTNLVAVLIWTSYLRMDDSAHVFLIKDKIRCIQKKIMDQLAADLNSALNDANILTSSVSNVTMTPSSASKSRRRRRRPVNTGIIQQNIDASDSTTPENTGDILRHRRHDHQGIVSDGDEGTAMPWSKPSKIFDRELTLCSSRNAFISYRIGIGFNFSDGRSTPTSSTIQEADHSIDNHLPIGDTFVDQNHSLSEHQDRPSEQWISSNSCTSSAP